MSRQNNFDALRLLAAALVAVLHVVELSGEPVLRSALGWLPTQWGLPIFFILSGHLVFASWMQRPQWRDYLERRLRRILPAYVAVVMLCALGGGLLSSLGWWAYLTDPAWWRYVAANLLFLNFLQPGLPGVFQVQPVAGVVNGSLWTIKVELMFYAVVPVVAWAVRRGGASPVLALGYLASAAWWVFFTDWAVQSGRPIGHELAKQMPGQLMYFLAGAWAWCERARWRPWAAPLGAAGLLIMVLVTLYDQHPNLGADVWDVLAPLGLTAVVMTLALGCPHATALQPRNDLSYGLYLWHFPLVQATVALGVFAWQPWAGVIVATGLTIVMAWASWRWIEAPFLRR